MPDSNVVTLRDRAAKFMRFADTFPRAIAKAYFTTNRTGCIFYHWEVMTLGDLHNGVHVTRHAHLVYGHDGTCPGCDRCFDERGIDVIRRGINVDKNRYRTAVADGIGGRNERMADGDDFVPRLHAYNQEGKM